MNPFTDKPKLLKDPAAKAERYGRLHLPHIAPLTKFVEDLRAEKGTDYQLPYFDPWDGGIEARVLFLLEAPGAKAVFSGFISRNNPDETAKNFYQLNSEARIPREETVTWNVVPWYIGTGVKIRPAKADDIAAGMRGLQRLLDLLPNLQVIVLVGQKAQRAEEQIQMLRANVKIFRSPHPSPLFVNHVPENRWKILASLQAVKTYLDSLV